MSTRIVDEVKAFEPLVRCSCSTDFLCFDARLIHGDYRRAAERSDASAMGRIEDAWTDHRRAAGCVTANAVRCIPRTDVDPYSPNNHPHAPDSPARTKPKGKNE